MEDWNWRTDHVHSLFYRKKAGVSIPDTSIESTGLPPTKNGFLMVDYYIDAFDQLVKICTLYDGFQQNNSTKSHFSQSLLKIGPYLRTCYVWQWSTFNCTDINMPTSWQQEIDVSEIFRKVKSEPARSFSVIIFLHTVALFPKLLWLNCWHIRN